MRLLEIFHKKQIILHKYLINKYLQPKLLCINEAGKYYESMGVEILNQNLSIKGTLKSIKNLK